MTPASWSGHTSRFLVCPGLSFNVTLHCLPFPLPLSPCFAHVLSAHDRLTSTGGSNPRACHRPQRGAHAAQLRQEEMEGETRMLQACVVRDLVQGAAGAAAVCVVTGGLRSPGVHGPSPLPSSQACSYVDFNDKSAGFFYWSLLLEQQISRFFIGVYF